MFAQLRERAGAEYIDAALPDGATVAEALRELAAKPPLGELLARLPVRMAVNRELAEPHTALRADEVRTEEPHSQKGDHLASLTRTPRGAPQRRKHHPDGGHIQRGQRCVHNE